MDNLITGQLIFRESGQKNPDGRKLMMVVGIIAVPEDAQFKGEHQNTFAGQYDKDLNATVLTVLNDSVDVSAKTIGDSLGGLILQPIWRV